MTTLRRIRRITIGLIFVALGVYAWATQQAQAPTVVHIGTPAIALSYMLTDAAGRTVTEHTFHGRPVVYLFGWANDPDLTPAALQVLAAALGQTKARDIVPIFITLDPARDTEPVLAALLNRSSIPIVTLRGQEGEIARLTQSARLHVRRIDDPSAPGGYRLDHTVVYLVVGRDGRFAGVVPYETSAGTVATSIDGLVR
jgi:protein SCO1/2